METHGLSRSPTRANFQNRPRNLRRECIGSHARLSKRPTAALCAWQRQASCAGRQAAEQRRQSWPLLPRAHPVRSLRRAGAAWGGQRRWCRSAESHKRPQPQLGRPPCERGEPVPFPLTYVHVQMASSNTTTKDEKLKSADMALRGQGCVPAMDGENRASRCVFLMDSIGR